jgi:ABC-type uncharacterized transport system auxiliary subunit
MAGMPPEAQRRAVMLAGLAAVPAWLAGCSLPSAPRQEFHLLRDGGAASPSGNAPAAPRVDKVLLVNAHASPGLYGGDRMVFSADGHSRSYFQFGYWSERPAQTLQTLAIARLAQAQRFSEVASSTAGVRGELLLTLRLDELYLDASADPGQVRLIVNAELVDWRQRSLLARRTVQHVTAAPQRDASGLASAASLAVGALLDDLVAWAAAAAA